METITTKELVKIRLFKSERAIFYQVQKGNLPTPIKIKNESYFELKEINKIFGIKNVKETEFIDVDQCSKMLDIFPVTLRAHVRNKKIPNYRLTNYKGSKILFDKSQIEKINDDMKLTFNFSDEMFHYKVMKDYVARLLSTQALTSILSEREINILKEIYINKVTLNELSQRYNLNRETISQIKGKAERKINYRLRRLSDTRKKNKEIIVENRILKYKIFELESYMEKNADSEKIKQIKEFKEFKEFENLIGYELDDLDLSVRCYNSLRSAGLYFVIDVIVYCKKYGFDRLVKFRNLGVSSSNELRNIILKKFDIDLLILK